jgi:hypothetical protein
MMQVDPGFVYEVVALKIEEDTITDFLVVGWVFFDIQIDKEYWAMTSAWESPTGAIWKRKPGFGKPTVIRLNPIASFGSPGYPKGSTHEERRADFYSNLQLGKNGRTYTHTITTP